MVEKIAEYLWGFGYGVQRTNVDSARILYKIEGSDATVIILFDFEMAGTLTLEQYKHILEQIEEAYANKGYQQVKILGLICTSKVEEVKEYCQIPNYAHWIVNTLANRLVIFENQPATFGNLRSELDSILTGNTDTGTFDMREPAYTNATYTDYNEGRLDRNFKFDRDSWKGKPLFTVLLIVINTIILILMEKRIVELQSDSFLGYLLNYGDNNNVNGVFQMQTWLDWGATNYERIIGEHEYFRLFTAMFLHSGFYHLIGNMVTLGIVGQLLETRFGSIRFIIIYLISGVLANVVSLFYFHSIGENIVGLGASGAIFGIIGAFSYLVIRYRGKGYNITTKGFILFLCITIFNGFQANENVDNVAHIAGFFIGVLTCIILDIIRRNQKDRVM